MDAALGPDILAEHQHARVGLELLVEHAADRGDHVDPLARRARLVGRAVEAQPGAAADLLHLAFEEDVARDVVGRGHAARLGLGARRLDLPADLALEVRPLLVADLKLRDMALSLGSGSRAHSASISASRLVGLGVLEAVALEPRHGQPQQRRRALGADMGDRLADQPRRFLRIGAVAVEDRQAREAREVRGDVAARGLVIRRHRDAVAIVLDVNEQRQLLRRRNS